MSTVAALALALWPLWLAIAAALIAGRIEAQRHRRAEQVAAIDGLGASR